MKQILGTVLFNKQDVHATTISINKDDHCFRMVGMTRL